MTDISDADAICMIFIAPHDFEKELDSFLEGGFSLEHV
jgi:hypothetical protein